MGTEEGEIADIALKARKSLHFQQSKSTTWIQKNAKMVQKRLPTQPPLEEYLRITPHYIPNDKLLVNDEFLIEKL